MSVLVGALEGLNVLYKHLHTGEMLLKTKCYCLRMAVRGVAQKCLLIDEIDSNKQ